MSLIGGVILVSVDKKAPTERAAEASAQGLSTSLVDLIIESPGEGWFSVTNPCKSSGEDKDFLTPEQVSRFGLGSEDCAPTTSRLPSNMSFTKLVNLQRAALAADSTNGYMDYEEARITLGLDETNHDFHLRTEPVLASIRELLEKGYKDPNMRPVYIGDYAPADETIFQGLDVTPGYTDSGTTGPGSILTLWVSIRNNGMAPSIFEVGFTLHLDDSSVELLQHTPPLAVNETYNVTVTIPKSSDWSWSSTNVEYIVSDPTRVLEQGTIDVIGVNMVGSAENKFFGTHAGNVQYELTGASVTPKVYYDVFEGDGDSPSSYSDWKIEVYNSLGLLVASDTSLHSRGWESFTLLLPDTYRVQLKTLLGVPLAEERITVVSDLLKSWSKSASLGIIPEESVHIESGYIAALVENFDPFVFHSEYDFVTLPYQEGGDIYPDVKSVMNNDLPDALIDDKGTTSPNDDEGTLDTYNVMFVGSHVDHQVMTSQAAKDSIRAWVYAGGVLIVMGSNDQAVQWLQPIFHSSITSGSGGLATPDENHPVLKVPNELDYKSYDSHGIAWDFSRPQDEQHFTHVLLQGDDDLLALSDHGEFGDGRVLLSAFQAYDMYAGAEQGCDLGNLQASCAGLMLVHNLITQAYHGLFIDYGPPLPTHSAVGVTMRLASLWHPELKEMVAVRVQVYVF